MTEETNPIIIPVPPVEAESFFRYNQDLHVFEYVNSLGNVAYHVNPSNVADTLTNAHREQTKLVAQITELRNEQIKGSDSRLTDFWAKAQELADKHNWCDEFDEIAEALGGPAREREYEVTFTYTGSYVVTARDEHDAIDAARELITDSYTIADLFEDDAEVKEF